MTETINARLREDFITLIAQRTGIEIRTQNYTAMGDNIFSRVKALNLSSAQAYYNLLIEDNEKSEEEWQQFVCLLTNKESYFFRDKGQFTLLRQTILPELIRRNRRTKTLKILSAGCSTGQEPYSIAILLKELIKELEDWHLTIVGVDINRESLAQGKRASYNTWSFRQVEDDIKERYFKNSAGFYQLHPDVRKLVQFHQVNLVRDELPKPQRYLSDMDFIICRNVFIYFTDDAIARVMEKFFHTLKPNGYLMTGHAELNNEQLKGFNGKVYSESIVFQRKTGNFAHLSSQNNQYKSYSSLNNKTSTPTTANVFPSLTVNSPPPIPPITTKEIKPITTTSFPTSSTKLIPKTTTPENKNKPNNQANSDLPIQEIEELITHKSYTLAETKLKQFLIKNSRNFQANYLMAEIQANLGKYDLAQQWIDKALELDNLAIKPYYLSAQISEEIGDREKAKQALKQIIYLDYNSVQAYINLAGLYQLENDNKRSEKMRSSAIKVLKTMPEDEKISELDNISVQDLITQLGG